MRRAPERGEDERGRRRRATSRTSDRHANHSGHRAVDEDAADADEEQQPVGDRVEDLAEVGHLVEVAGDVAVDPVGGAEGRQQHGGRGPVVPAEQQLEEQRQAASRTTVMTFGTVRMRLASPARRWSGRPAWSRRA